MAVLSFLICAAAAGCQPQATDDSSESAAESAATAEAAASGGQVEGSTLDDAQRLVTLGGGVSEVVAALGFEAQIVAVDVSSVHPPSLTELPQVGYHRALSAEGIIAVNPTAIFGSETDGPPAAVASLDGLEIPYLRVPEVATVEDAFTRIRTLATALERQEAGEALIADIQTKLDAVAATVPDEASRPKVIVIYARGHGTLLATGTASAGDTMITLAGGRNAIAGYEGFRPLTPEALVAAQPDVIVVPERGLESLGGTEGLLALPGMAETPAGQASAFVVMDDALLLSFGPRLGEAVETLAAGLQAAPRAAGLQAVPRQ